MAMGRRSGAQRLLSRHQHQKLIQTARGKVNACFPEIIHEIKQLQTKVLDFVAKEKMAAMGKRGSSIQLSHNRLLKQEGEFPMLQNLPACIEPLIGTNCEETQSFLQLPENLAELPTQLVDMGVSFINQLFLKGYCNLNFDPSTASEELFLFKETHSVLNLGIPLEPSASGGPLLGFKQWPQVLSSRVATRATASATCWATTPYSWGLEWDSLSLSVWHGNSQTVLRGAHHRALGVALDLGAGCLSYSVAVGERLLYRFLTAFLQPL
ncbi:hypothetical protein GW7_04483 [Heterocephalus glaber]|uniref:Uncharacterized protein n=1 Tax=Heterocephalus glaber TaxID=10181 RepID=G5BNC9_HETGA|nr:hypothetical protein GW7_04483 [Heterocephalus glaber]